MIGKYNMLLALFIIQLKLALAGFSCHSSLNENGSGSNTVTGDQECNDFSFKDDHSNVLKIGQAQAVYKFSDCVPNITFFCNMPSRATAVCKNECPPKDKPGEISERNNTAKGGGGLSASRIVGIVLGVMLSLSHLVL